MTFALRDYQVRCVEETRQAFRASRSVCIVAPTGAGKTVLGLEIVRRTLAAKPTARALWIAHRTELIDQARIRAEDYLGADADRMDVATVQGLASSGARPRADLLVLDEAHHYGAGAAQWHDVIQHYGGAWRLGLTATPQRADGSPLGDVFGAMVVAAQYSELVEAGHLVPCEVLRPADTIRGVDVAPELVVSAWQEHASGRQGFIFGRLVAECHAYADALRGAGVTAEVISGETTSEDRDLFLHEFKAGKIRALVSVFVLTEGIDVPAAAVCMLARGCGASGTFLQMAGRVLRPAPGKTDAVLIDLLGASWIHGIPTADREYALEGRAIRVAGQQDREDSDGEGEPDDRPVIYSLELSKVFDGENTPPAAKRAEWERVSAFARARGWCLTWAAKEYAKLFAGPPPASMDEKADAMRTLRARAAEKGYKSGWASHRYRQAFGVWPKGV